MEGRNLLKGRCGSGKREEEEKKDVKRILRRRRRPESSRPDEAGLGEARFPLGQLPLSFLPKPR